MNQIKEIIDFEDFSKTDIRIGTIIEVINFEKARKPAYQITIDFGSLGVKKSSAQITTLYSKGELVGKQVCAVINFKPLQIADFKSECLILGIQNGKDVVLLKASEKTLKTESKSHKYKYYENIYTISITYNFKLQCSKRNYSKE